MMDEPHPNTRPRTRMHQNPHSVSNRVVRVLWWIVQGTVFKWSPRPLLGWRRFLLRLFKADIHPKARVYPKVKIWGPWNLSMDAFATLADDVDCYCVERIRIGARTTVSQYSYLCGATHDFKDPLFPLIPMPITIGADCWVAADVFVAPGVTIGDGTVVGARSSVFKDLPEWKVCAGTPAKPIGDRVMREKAGPEVAADAAEESA